LGDNWYVKQQYIKLYPVCRWAQPAAEAVLALVKKHNVAADQVVDIMIETFHEAKRLTAIPENTEQAQYSLPFSVAAALVRGTIGVKEITGDGLNDAQIIDLAKRVEITETDEFNSAFPARRFARAYLHLKDGSVLISDGTEAQGDPENKVSDDIIWPKYKQLTSSVIGNDRSQKIITEIRNLETQKSIEGLFKLISEPI
jgi:2-methylcitrate dehydratase PrpD